MNEETDKKQPPYLSYTTLKNFLASLKNGVIPARIDKSLMAGQSGATQSYLMSALRFFDLLEGNDAPTGELKALITRDGEERKKVWRPIFERGYKPILGELDLSTATVGMLNERFAAQGLASETVKKVHSFFAAAAEDAGAPLSAQLKPNTRGGGARKGKRRSKQPGTPENITDDFSDSDQNGSGGKTPPSQIATLLLDGAGTRSVKLKAPPTISQAELERIQQWLKFQFIVEE